MDNSDIQKLVEISRMYYSQGMNQEQIAKVFGISRSAVSMSLSEAKNNGLIQVLIKDPSVNNEDLANQLTERFGLRKCIVIPSGSHNSEVLLRIVTSQAVRFAAQDLFSSHSSIGIAWGKTCGEFMRAFPDETDICDVNVVPLIGASPLLTQEYQLNESIRLFANKLRGFPLYIYAPGVVDTLDDKKRILESTFMQPILDRWKNMDYAILGIGCLDNVQKHNYKKNKTILEEINRYKDMTIGDICARQFNILGQFIENDHNSKLIGVDSENLKKIKHVMAIAVGSNKIFAIIGALRTGVIHYFATDENTAKQVLDLLDSGTLPS